MTLEVQPLLEKSVWVGGWLANRNMSPVRNTDGGLNTVAALDGASVALIPQRSESEAAYTSSQFGQGLLGASPC